MENEFFIALEAHNSTRNCRRRYEISVGRDLFGAWTVTIRYGRTGGGCREERYASGELGSLEALLLRRCQRRKSATRRIGSDYRVVDFRNPQAGPHPTRSWKWISFTFCKWRPLERHSRRNESGVAAADSGEHNTCPE